MIEEVIKLTLKPEGTDKVTDAIEQLDKLEAQTKNLVTPAKITKLNFDIAAARKNLAAVATVRPALHPRADGLRPDLAPPPIRDPLGGGKKVAGLTPTALPIILALLSPSVIGAIINRYDPHFKGAAERYFLDPKKHDSRFNEYLLGTGPGGLYAGIRATIDTLRHPEGLPTIPDPRYREARKERARIAEENKAAEELKYPWGRPKPKAPVYAGGNTYYVAGVEEYEKLMKGISKGSIDVWAPHLSKEKLKGTRWQKPHKPPATAWDSNLPEKTEPLNDTSPLNLIPPYASETRKLPPAPSYSFVLGSSTTTNRQAELEAELEEAVMFQHQAEGEEALLSLEAEKESILDLVEALKQEGEILETIELLKAEGDILRTAEMLKTEGEILKTIDLLKQEGDILKMVEALKTESQTGSIPPYVSQPPTISPSPTYYFDPATGNSRIQGGRPGGGNTYITVHKLADTIETQNMDEQTLLSLLGTVVKSELPS